MKKPTLRQRARYAFDNTMSRGTPALIGWLGIAALVMILIPTIIVEVAHLAPGEGGGRQGFIGELYESFLRTLDPGTVAGDEGGIAFLAARVLVTLGGIFLVGSLIGIITTGLGTKIEELRRGHSLVVEKGHTLILGWSEQVFIILRQLAIANAGDRNPCAVILADEDKVEMEHLVRTRVGHTNGTRVVCRRGSPMDADALNVASVHAARSVIVLPPNEPTADAEVIKTLLAITNSDDRREGAYHIVAEIQEGEHLPAAKLAGGDETQIIDVSETVARLIVQTGRQTGLSVVYTDLFDFEGDEIYFHADTDLRGRTYGDALVAYENASVIGIRDATGRIELNPPPHTPLGEGAELIAVTEDDLAPHAWDRSNAPIDPADIDIKPPNELVPENLLILGWNRGACLVVKDLDQYVAPGSKLTIVADHPGGESEIAVHCPNLSNLEVTYREGDTSDRATLDDLHVEDFEHVIVLCYSDILEPERADAQTLVTLLHLRDIEAKLGERFSTVSEMLNDRNRKLAEVTKVDDFIVSDNLISLIATQISENEHLKDVFADLLDAEGAEIYLKPIGEYVTTGEPVNFRTLVEAARQRGESAIGYRDISRAADSSAAYGVTVNPPKSREFPCANGDRLVVVAES